MSRSKLMPTPTGQIIAQLDILVAALIRVVGKKKVLAEAEKVKNEILIAAQRNQENQCLKTK
jgi:hypothetical protein